MKKTFIIVYKSAALIQEFDSSKACHDAHPTAQFYELVTPFIPSPVKAVMEKAFTAIGEYLIDASMDGTEQAQALKDAHIALGAQLGLKQEKNAMLHSRAQKSFVSDYPKRRGYCIVDEIGKVFHLNGAQRANYTDNPHFFYVYDTPEALYAAFAIAEKQAKGSVCPAFLNGMSAPITITFSKDEDDEFYRFEIEQGDELIEGVITEDKINMHDVLDWEQTEDAAIELLFGDVEVAEDIVRRHFTNFLNQ